MSQQDARDFPFCKKMSTEKTRNRRVTQVLCTQGWSLRVCTQLRPLRNRSPTSMEFDTNPNKLLHGACERPWRYIYTCPVERRRRRRRLSSVCLLSTVAVSLAVPRYACLRVNWVGFNRPRIDRGCLCRVQIINWKSARKRRTHIFRHCAIKEIIKFRPEERETERRRSSLSSSRVPPQGTMENFDDNIVRVAITRDKVFGAVLYEIRYTSCVLIWRLWHN